MSAVITNRVQRPRKGGVKGTTAASVAETRITMPAGVAGFYISTDQPFRLFVGDATVTAVADAAYGYFAVATVPLAFFVQSAGDTTIHLSPETAVALTYRIAYF